MRKLHGGPQRVLLLSGAIVLLTMTGVISRSDRSPSFTQNIIRPRRHAAHDLVEVAQVFETTQAFMKARVLRG